MTRFAALLVLTLALPAQAATLGPELVSDSEFTTGAGWTLGAQWQITPGQPPAQGFAYHNEGSTSYLSTSATMAGGATHRITYVVSSTSTSSDPRHWVVLFGSSGGVATPVSSGAGTFTFDVSAPDGGHKVGLRAMYGCACVIDSVSVREITP